MSMTESMLSCLDLIERHAPRMLGYRDMVQKMNVRRVIAAGVRSGLVFLPEPDEQSGKPPRRRSGTAPNKALTEATREVVCKYWDHAVTPDGVYKEVAARYGVNPKSLQSSVSELRRKLKLDDVAA